MSMLLTIAARTGKSSIDSDIFHLIFLPVQITDAKTSPCTADFARMLTIAARTGKSSIDSDIFHLIFLSVQITNAKTSPCTADFATMLTIAAIIVNSMK